MALPVRLKFFQKLELYQELKKENKKRKGDKLWNMVKVTLKWTVKGHQHLYTPLSSGFIMQTLTEIKSNENIDDEVFSIQDINNLYEKVLGDLTVRGYALALQESKNEVQLARITPEGLYMGEVIYDYESGGWSKARYWMFYYLTWGVVILGIVKLILSVIGEPSLLSLIERLINN